MGGSDNAECSEAWDDPLPDDACLPAPRCSLHERLAGPATGHGSKQFTRKTAQGLFSDHASAIFPFILFILWVRGGEKPASLRGNKHACQVSTEGMK